MTIDETKLRQLVTVFLEENKKLNLSAFRTEEHCWVGNVLDSLSLLQALEKIEGLSMPETLLDIGTGGGFPLLPLAICLPKTHCSGIDATKKKIDAVARIVASLGLTNVGLFPERFESKARDKNFREKYDIVTARAVAPISILLEYAVPFLKIGGFCAFWKSSKVADELAGSVKAQKALSVSFAGTYEYELSPDFGKRLIVFFKKTKATSSEYPRKVGIPKSDPL
ncbi:16S rRNA (guanine(527)-N(7))-methyltransferase RsmG [Candidatus Peribacteria bacterium]|nr:16S rRNA (guanine(527)-N(7))-methyltransferase RsmG [Candidatus Peribacteria bacterium]